MLKANPTRLANRSRLVYEVRPRKDHRGVNLISDVLPFGRLWYGGPNAVSNAVGYAKFRSRSHDAVIRVYDETGNVIEISAPSRAGSTSKDFPLFRTSARAHSAILSTI
jgi:hypothetical protein